LCDWNLSPWPRIRTDEHLAITLYRDGLSGAALRVPPPQPEIQHRPEALAGLPLAAARVS